MLHNFRALCKQLAESQVNRQLRIPKPITQLISVPSHYQLFANCRRYNKYKKRGEPFLMPDFGQLAIGFGPIRLTWLAVAVEKIVYMTKIKLKFHNACQVAAASMATMATAAQLMPRSRTGQSISIGQAKAWSSLNTMKKSSRAESTRGYSFLGSFPIFFFFLFFVQECNI